MTVLAETFASANLNLKETPAFTNLENWRLKVVEGAQTWHYLSTDEERKAWPQTLWDRYHLGLALVCSSVYYSLKCIKIAYWLILIECSRT
jgi:lanosterol synthase